MGQLSAPRQLALDLLVEVGVRSPAEICPIEAAKEKRIEIAFGHLTGAAARIYRVGRRARVRVSHEIQTEARRRSSIMHELGHMLLEHTLPREGDDASWFATSCARRSKVEERAAEVFMVEYLTPTHWVRPYCDVASFDLDAVRAIERDFRTSPVMSAIRLVELSRHACAVVYSERGRVRWMKPSRTFPAFLPRDHVLAVGSVAQEYFDSGSLPMDARRERASTWVPETALANSGDLEIVEQAMRVPEPGWGGVLSLLSKWIGLPIHETQRSAGDEPLPSSTEPLSTCRNTVKS